MIDHINQTPIITAIVRNTGEEIKVSKTREFYVTRKNNHIYWYDVIPRQNNKGFWEDSLRFI